MGNAFCCVVVPHCRRGIVETCRTRRVLAPGLHCLCWPRGEVLAGSVATVPQFLSFRCEARTQDNVDVVFMTTIEYRVRTFPVGQVKSAYENRDFLGDKFQLEMRRAIRHHISTRTFVALRIDALEEAVLGHLTTALDDWGFNVRTCGIEFRRKNH